MGAAPVSQPGERHQEIDLVGNGFGCGVESRFGARLRFASFSRAPPGRACPPKRVRRAATKTFPNQCLLVCAPLALLLNANGLLPARDSRDVRWSPNLVVYCPTTLVLYRSAFSSFRLMARSAGCKQSNSR
jgi:hypothetical protein